MESTSSSITSREFEVQDWQLVILSGLGLVIVEFIKLSMQAIMNKLLGHGSELQAIECRLRVDAVEKRVAAVETRFDDLRDTLIETLGEKNNGGRV